MQLNMLTALQQALLEEMSVDDRVILIGEDIGVYGGAFKVTDGLFKKFGSERVIDTPIAEGAVLGVAIGASVYGLRAVAELQFMDFISCGGFDQLVSVAAKFRYRNGVGCPIVIRGPCGAGVRGGPFHSICPEMWAITTPGIKVVFPSTAYDAKGLLKASIRDPDPVLFLEHKFLYRRAKDDVPEEDYTIPLGKGIIRKEGDDLSIITYGAMTYIALEAANALNEKNIKVRVIDLRTLSPLDEEIISQAAQETNRVIIVHEHPKNGGIAGEISAIINERAFDYLDAPIMRVTPPQTPVPYAPTLEDEYLPKSEDIIKVANKILNY